MKIPPIVQEYKQKRHFHSHRCSPSPSTPSPLLISKLYIKGPNLMAVDIPWVAHQTSHHADNNNEEINSWRSVMIVFDDEEPEPLQREVGEGEGLRMGECINSETQC